MQRIAKACILMMATWILPATLQANEIRIIETRRNIPLTDAEPRYMDFYLNGGSENGVKKDQVVKVIRRTPIRNAQGTEEFGSLQIPVGELRIIFVDSRTSVGRMYKVYDREELPIIDSLALMIGDMIDLSGAFDYKKRAAVDVKKEI